MYLKEMIAGTLPHQWFVLAFFLLAFLIQMGIYLFVFLRLPLFKQKKKSSAEPGITVIVSAKNEEKNLEKFLPRILQQDYPEFEVVVVNDSSTDNSEQVLIRLAAQFRQLRYTTIPANDKAMRGKKLALTIGLKSARYDLVLLTDADCYPVSDQWLKSMGKHFTAKKKIVLGYGGYEPKKGLLNLLIRYETTFTAISYLSYAIKGEPYMGVGRNLAYHKALFFDNKGFAGHYHLLSGDDDLFVNENATKTNCAVEFSPESHTRSLPETTFRAWIQQKKRHLSAGSHYRRGSRIRLASEWISRIVLYITGIWICTSYIWALPAGILLGVAIMTHLIVFKLGMRRLDEKYLLLPSLLFNPIFPIFLGMIWFSSRFDKKYQTWR
ncbi:MAG: glycosyltransferase [Bacteroidales bacterium]|nr:glycosyltransferase [Bacteroidales bacterium]